MTNLSISVSDGESEDGCGIVDGLINGCLISCTLEDGCELIAIHVDCRSCSVGAGVRWVSHISHSNSQLEKMIDCFNS